MGGGGFEYLNLCALLFVLIGALILLLLKQLISIAADKS